MTQWVRLANYASGLEADMVVERLRGAGLTADVRGRDIVGVVGPSFQGVTARGVDVLVLDSELEQARTLLAEDNEEA
jgi:hypothetical protein